MKQLLAILILSLALCTQAQESYTGYVIFPASLAEGRVVALPYTDLGDGYYMVSAELTWAQVEWALSLYEVYKHRLAGVRFWLVKDGEQICFVC